MPRATVTTRVLKNKTGLELYVPSYSQSKGVITSTVLYQVVVVSSLACFKSPSHKDTDVVQYSLDKKWAEFEDLRSSLSEKFSGTVLPPISKKSILADASVLRDRKNSLDHLLKVIASTPKLSTCVPILTFLGIDSVRARKFDNGEPLDTKATASTESQDTLAEGAEKGMTESESTDAFAYGEEEDSGNEDFFGDATGGEEEMDNMFGNSDSKRSVAVFEGQDMKRDLTDEDERDFAFVPDGILTKKEVTRQELFGEEDEDGDLLEIEDDLDKLMNINKDTKKAGSSSLSATTTAENTTDTGKPVKPVIGSKPSIPSKPKPQIASKPNSLVGQHSSSSSSSSSKPDIPPKQKSSLPSKPGSAAVTELFEPEKISGQGKSQTETDSDRVENLGQDDILKYLQDNLDSNTEEVDLFS